MTMTKPTSEQVTFTAAGSGAVMRNLVDKVREVVSVKDFGAVGDGVADDTTAFTNAVTAAGTKNVFVPGGSYKITGTVTGSFYSDATVTIVSGTVNTINRIGSVLSTTGALTVTGTAATGALTVTGTAATGALTVTGTASVSDNVIISTSGKGIDFSAASHSGGMTSELLNDYEEGNWVPLMRFGGAGVGITYTTQQGRYIKIGRVVIAQAFVSLSSKGTSTGNATIEGLPFVMLAGDAGYCTCSVRTTSVAFSGQVMMLGIENTSTVRLDESTLAGVPTTITNADFANNSSVIIQISYIAA